LRPNAGFMLVEARCIEPLNGFPFCGLTAETANLGFKFCRALGATPRRDLE
jgi:hypothetical protein